MFLFEVGKSKRALVGISLGIITGNCVNVQLISEHVSQT